MLDLIEIIFDKGGRSGDLFQKYQSLQPLRSVRSSRGFQCCRGRAGLRRGVQEERARPQESHIPLPIAAPQ